MKRVFVMLTVIVAAGVIAASALRLAKSPAVTELAYKDLVRIESPLPNSVISSPFVIRGAARGNWYFEASFPVRLLDANGNDIPLDPPYVMTAAEWMTAEFVPFEATLVFTAPTTGTGTFILQKDNPSGLAEHDDEVRIPVRFLP